jgi:L-ascorbate metabolism protein UlaG (beta-lactamase superfamily)
MIITWLGHSCFKIQDKNGAEGVTLVTDPFDKSVGIKVPSLEADIVTVSHDHGDHSNLSAVKGKPFVVDTPGEYEVKGVCIEGVAAKHDDKEGIERGSDVMFRIDMEGITVVHLGDLGHVLDSKQVEKLAGTDILLLPVGGNYTIDAKKAVEVVSQLEPRIVIPMHYKIEGVKMDIEEVDKFVKEMGLEPRREDKLKISRKDLPQDEMQLVILSC